MKKITYCGNEKIGLSNYHVCCEFHELLLDLMFNDWRYEAIQIANSNEEVNKKTLEGLKEYRKNVSST